MSFFTSVKEGWNEILFRGVVKGRRVQKKIPFKPKLYIKSNTDPSAETMSGQKLSAISFDSISEARNWRRDQRKIEGFDIYGDVDFTWQFIAEHFKGEIDFNPSEILVYGTDIEVHSPDEFPNPEEAKYPITAITVGNKTTKQKYTFALNNQWIDGADKSDFDPSEYPNLEYKEYQDEEDLLREFLDFWSLDYCDVLTGWNTDGFDIPYIINRIVKILGEDACNRLSPWGKIKKRTSKNDWGKPVTEYEIVGIESLDYLNLYKKYTYSKQESYSLDHIAFVELGERKLSYDEYSGLHELYIKDYPKYIRYNIKDEDLVQRLDEKMKLIDIVFSVSYFAKMNYQDTFGPVKTWDCLIYQNLVTKGIQPPPNKRTRKDHAIPGAYVKEPIPGFYKWVVSFDLASLYPSLIRQYNLGIDTHITYDELPEEVAGLVPNISEESILNRSVDLSVLKKYDICVTPNREFFRTDKKSILSEIMEILYGKRKDWKKQMLESEDMVEQASSEKEKKEAEYAVSKFTNLQMAAKILLNAGYGATTNEHFRYYKDEVARSITLSGQLTIKWAEKTFNGYLQNLFKDEKDRVIAGDTDSNYICLDDLVTQISKKRDMTEEETINFLDKVCEDKLFPEISESYKYLYEYLNAYQNLMIMEREVLATSAVWVAKKKYFMDVKDSEGVRYAEPKLKVKGMESVKAEFPKWARDRLKNAYSLILQGNESVMHSYIEEKEKEWKSQPIEDIAKPTGLNVSLDKYSSDTTIWSKGAMAHVKSALIYNHLVKTRGLEDRLTLIESGNDIKWVKLKHPNPIHTETVGFLDFLPKEFGLDEYVDYDALFEKNFLNPLKIALSAVNWTTEEVGTLDAFM